MPADRVAFALWRACVTESELLVLRRSARAIELQLRGGNAGVRSIVLAQTGNA